MLNDKCVGAFNFENNYKRAVSALYGGTHRERDRDETIKLALEHLAS